METLTNPKRTRGQEAMERLEVILKNIKKKVIRFTITVMTANAIFYGLLMLWFWFDFDRINKVYTNSFQYQCVAWVCMFMYGYFLRVEAKQDISLAMGHDSVDLMAKVDESIEKRAQRLDRLMDSGERFLEELREGKGKLVERFEQVFKSEMEKLRSEIKADREAVDQELGQALEEGERQAAEISEESSTKPEETG